MADTLKTDLTLLTGSIPAIAGIEDPSQARMVLYQAGRPVHAPLDQVGLLTDTEGASTYLTQVSAASTYLTQVSAASTYLTQVSAASTYLTQVSAASTYHPVSELTDWVTYTPTFTGFGTATSVSFWSKRIADTLLVSGRFTVGTPTATEARISMGFNGVSANVASDATKVPSLRIAGFLTTSLLASAGYNVLVETSVTYMTFGGQNTSFGGLTKRNGDTLTSTGATVSFIAQIPIAGW